jgi:hypothetical protein
MQLADEGPRRGAERDPPEGCRAVPLEHRLMDLNSPAVALHT